METLILGLLSGIFSYFFIQLVLKLFRPKVAISKKIAGASSSNTYRIKIENKSNRNIGDVVISVSYISKRKGHYTYSIKDIPILHSNKDDNNSVTVGINPAQIHGGKFETAKDFFRNNPEGYIEVDVYYSDVSFWSFFWSNMRWSRNQIYQHGEDILENSIFVAGLTEPQSFNDYKNRYNNC